MPRFGIKWNGDREPITTPMDDGYWTPYHLAVNHLAAHDAEVAKVAFIAGAMASIDVAYSGKFEIEEDAEIYAERIRTKAKP